VQGGIEGQSLTAEDQLLILMQAGQCLTPTVGKRRAPQADVASEYRFDNFLHSSIGYQDSLIADTGQLLAPM
jgi:hypothetical protein